MRRNKCLIPKQEKSVENDVLKFMASIHNRFDIEVIDAETGNVKQNAKAENVVLNAYWSNFTYSSTPYIAFGKGSGTPTPTRTSMFSEVASKWASHKGTTMSYKDCVLSRTYYITLSETENVGVTLTEVGLKKGSNLVTHAMITDMNGNKISIQKTSTDIINIYATIFVHFSAGGYQDGTMFLTNNDRIVTDCAEFSSKGSSNRVFFMDMMWPSAWDSYWTRYQSVTLASTNTSQQNAQSITLNHKFSRLPAGSGNYTGGICGMMFGYESGINSFNAYLFMLPKTKSRILSEAFGSGDGSTKNFKTEFHLPSNAIVYVDGVAKTSGVTVVPDLSGTYDFSRMWVPIVPESHPDAIIVDSTTTWVYTCTNSVMMYYHVYNELVAIESVTIKGTNRTLFVSDDLISWTEIGKTGSTDASRKLQVPTEYSKYKYWKVVSDSNESLSSSYEISVKGVNLTGYSVRFDEAPPAGSVLTIDYDTPMIPKNVNHVFDMELSITAGAYQEV